MSHKSRTGLLHLLNVCGTVPSGSPDLHAAERGQHLPAVVTVSLRQRLPVPPDQRRGGANKAQRDAALLRPLLPGLVLRTGRGTAASRRRNDPEGQTGPSTAAHTAAGPVPSAISHQPGVPLPRGSHHPPSATSPRTTAPTTELSGQGRRLRVRRHAIQRVEVPLNTRGLTRLRRIQGRDRPSDLRFTPPGNSNKHVRLSIGCP